MEKIIDVGNKDSAGSDDDVQSDTPIPEFYIKEQKLIKKAKNKSQSEKGFPQNQQKTKIKKKLYKAIKQKNTNGAPHSSQGKDLKNKKKPQNIEVSIDDIKINVE